MRPTRRLTIAAALALLATTPGCSFLHELKPHRLWRLNRHSSPMRGGSSAYYSVADPPPVRVDHAGPSTSTSAASDGTAATGTISD